MAQTFTCSQGHQWPAPDGPATACPTCGAAALPLGADDWPTARVDLRISGVRVHMEIPVPPEPTRPVELLPQFQAVTEALVQLGVRGVEEQGETVSCRKGCGACCRQLVPISEVEAHAVLGVLERLPEPRRAEVRGRFAAARRRLEEAGLLEQLEHPERFPDTRLRPLAMEYFGLGIPCPFLEEESCSIHPDRPLACREYLVTSPAEHCARPSAETVRCVPLAGKPSTALTRLELDPTARFTRWVPLILAPQWAESHPDQAPPRSGPEILKEFFQRLTEPKKAAAAGEPPP